MKKVLLTVICALSLCACLKELDHGVYRKTTDEIIDKIEFSCNPYSLDNMRKAYASLIGTKSESSQLEATDYYVSFSPADTSEYRALFEQGLELFDYPLDAEVKQIQPLTEVDSTQLILGAKVYTVIPVNMVKEEITHDMIREAKSYQKELEFTYNSEFGIKGRIIEDCYIPHHDMSTKSGSVSHELLEEKAIMQARLNIDKEVITKAVSRKATGRVMFTKVESESVENPLPRIKVINQFFMKWDVTYTDDTGYYSSSQYFTFAPNVCVKFESERDDYRIWNKFNYLLTASYKCSSSNNSFNRKIVFNENSPISRGWAQTASCVHEYYEMCRMDGIALPPSDLSVNIFGNSNYSSAPMLGQIKKNRVSQIIEKYCSYVLPSFLRSSLCKALTFISLPDLFLGVEGDTYDSIRISVFHELSHASHYSVVGDEYWLDFIGYIVSSVISGQDCYGNGLRRDEAQRKCELGEAWAYANSRYFGEYSAGSSSWMDKSISAIYYLINPSGVINLTRKQVFDCLTKRTVDMDSFFQNVIYEYDSKSWNINEYLFENKVVRHFSKWLVFVDYEMSSLAFNKELNGIEYTSNVIFGKSEMIGYVIGDYINMHDLRKHYYLYPQNLHMNWIGVGIRSAQFYVEDNRSITHDFLNSFQNDKNWVTKVEYDSDIDVYLRINTYYMMQNK